MYSGGLVVGKASTIGIEISSTPRLIFTEGSKRAKFGVVFNITLSRPRLKMQQDIRTMNQISYVVMIALCPRQVW